MGAINQQDHLQLECNKDKTLLFAILFEKADIDELKALCKADEVYVLRHKQMQCMLKGVCSKCLFFNPQSGKFEYACKTQ